MGDFRVIKDPDADLDYAIEWASHTEPNDGTSNDDGWLRGDYLVQSTWSVTGPDPAMLIHNQAIGDIVDEDTKQVISTNTLAKVWLGGGTPNQSYRVVNSIVTFEGREEDRTIVVRVTQR